MLWDHVKGLENLLHLHVLIEDHFPDLLKEVVHHCRPILCRSLFEG